MEDEIEGRLLRAVLVGVLVVLISFSVNSLGSFLTHAFQTEKISNWDPVVTDDYSVDWRASHSEITAVFSYSYRGVIYEAQGFSPFKQLNKAAGENPKLVQRLLRNDHLPVTIYVNPENPKMASMASGWSRSGYSNDLNGVIILSLSFVGLFFCLQPTLRVQDLIPG